MSDALVARILESLPTTTSASQVLARHWFREYGLPSARDEAWRYSDLRALQNLDPKAGFQLDRQTPLRVELPGIAATLARFVAGAWQLADAPCAGLQVTIVDGTGLEAAIEHGLRSADADAFARLNAGGVSQLLLVDVSSAIKGRQCLDFQHDALGLSQCRVLVRVASGASIEVLEHWQGADSANGLCNASIQLSLAADARLNWLRLQNAGASSRLIQRTRMELGERAHVEYTAVELGAVWSRHDLQFAITGIGSKLSTHGVFALGGRQHQDTHLALDHRVPGADSRTLWKGVAQGRARAVFDGSISVHAGADGTSAQLRTANLLLSPHAEIDVKPELVIEADEVQCSHGATVGQLDERALFYLRSRGIPETLARRILTVAFCSEALRTIQPNALREAIEAAVVANLPDVSEDAASNASKL